MFLEISLRTLGAPNPDTYKIELAARLSLKNFPKFGKKEFGTTRVQFSLFRDVKIEFVSKNRIN
jgi:hypothetical protein